MIMVRSLFTSPPEALPILCYNAAALRACCPSFPGRMPGQDSGAPSVYHPYIFVFDNKARQCQRSLDTVKFFPEKS